MSTLRLGLTYALGDVALKGLSLILALAYANSLSTSDYGILAIVTAISAPVALFLGFGLKAAVFHFHFALQDTREQRSFQATAWLFTVAVPFVVLLLVDTLLGRNVLVLPGTGDISTFLRFALWADYLNTTFKLVIQEILRAEEKAKVYTALAFGNAATLLLLVILIVLFGRQGVMGVLVAMLLTGIVWAPVYAIMTARYHVLRLDLGLLMRGLKYSLPMQPHFLAHWLLNLSDRLILGWFAPTADVGVYSLGYRVGSAYEVLVTAGNSSIMPRFARAFTKGELVPSLARLFTYFALFMGFLALAAGAFSDEAIRLLVPKSYHGATAISKWIVMGFFALAMYYGPMNAVTLTAGQTSGVAKFTLLAGFINVVANLLFVPRFGVQAAAINTFVGYVVLFGLILRHSIRVARVSFELPKLAAIWLFLAVGLLIDSIVAPASIALGLATDVLILIGFVGIMRGLRVLDSGAIEQATMLLGSSFKRSPNRNMS